MEGRGESFFPALTEMLIYNFALNFKQFIWKNVQLWLSETFSLILFIIL